ncbi:AraC family transcriptional regulator [Actinoallomurus spadix]|uniref:AraC family transcriptional regulator n=1 Tax=Actinoallomurus spadix TaxID=79912 RepID=A0ABN0WLK3_9ACTN|nr:AraC family transcriptional regulator [Actinoallomurus spadix]MCO5984534.1 AraC family transcriptional regulator [Actinoallomurus spadix]
MDSAIERAIECIWERYSEPLSLTEIAESALLSRFYFARLFRDTTGITPCRFLAAIRIHQAKRLLLTSSMSITDISSAVGYNSLGSFTNYFTASVGVSPGRFRRLSRTGGFDLPGPQPDPRAGAGAVAGTISLPEGHGNARVYVGAFRTPIVQYPSAAAVIVDVPGGRPSCYHLPDVPEGTWFVRAVGVADGVGPDPWADRTTLVGGRDAVTVTADSVTSAAVRLRHGRPADPPVLLALPDLEPRPALAAVAGCPAITPRPVSAGHRRAGGNRRMASPVPARSPS